MRQASFRDRVGLFVTLLARLDSGQGNALRTLSSSPPSVFLPLLTQNYGFRPVDHRQCGSASVV